VYLGSSALKEPMNNVNQNANGVHRLHDSSADDVTLLQWFEGGCTDCFAILFRRHCKMSLAIAWRVLREKSEAEDIVQEVFLGICLKRNTYNEALGSVSNWIARFTQYKAMSRRRFLHTRATVQANESFEFEALTSSGSVHPNLIERLILVKECLATLSSRQRECIEAIHFQGLTLQEASVQIEESLANTRNLYYRGLKSLKVLLETPQVTRNQEQPSKTGEISLHRDPALLEAKI
jgi:RNA polymerase sigma-70 factor (ECF subfamily)